MLAVFVLILDWLFASLAFTHRGPVTHVRDYYPVSETDPKSLQGGYKNSTKSFSMRSVGATTMYNFDKVLQTIESLDVDFFLQ